MIVSPRFKLSSSKHISLFSYKQWILVRNSTMKSISSLVSLLSQWLQFLERLDIQLLLLHLGLKPFRRLNMVVSCSSINLWGMFYVLPCLPHTRQHIPFFATNSSSPWDTVPALYRSSSCLLHLQQVPFVVPRSTRQTKFKALTT